MALTVVWYDVVLIANSVNMVYSDHSVLYYRFGLSKNVFPLGRIRNSFPPLPYFGQTLFPPLSNLPFFCSPLKIHFPPTHRKNDRSLRLNLKNLILISCAVMKLLRKVSQGGRNPPPPPGEIGLNNVTFFSGWTWTVSA